MSPPTNTISARTSGGLLRRVVVIAVPILIVMGFIAAMLIVIAMNKTPKEKKKPFNTLAVMADYATQQTVQLSIDTQGEARPRTEIDLVPQVGGKIVYVSPNFIEGGIFKKGETLIRIEGADYEITKIRAEANVAQAQQLLVREMAESEIARQDYAELGRGTPSALALRQPQQQQAQASLQAAQAELQATELQLQRTYVRAPFSGRVRSKASDVGQFVSPGSRLGRIFSNDIVEVRLPLTDNDLSKINLPIAFVAQSKAEAPSVRLSAKVAGQLQNWEGHIMRTDASYDTQTRALFAIVEVVDPYGTGASDNGVPLAPGLFVDAQVQGKTFENMIVIPRDGLRPGDKVYVVNDKGKSQIRDVTVIDTNAQRAVISAGVEVGELVVLSPMEESRITMTLKVLDVNNPETVLVDPPKPDWMLKQEADEKSAEANGDTKKKRRRGKEEADSKPKKKTDKDAESGAAGKSDNSSASGGDN